MTSLHVTKRPVMTVPQGHPLVKSTPSFSKTHPRITPRRTTFTVDTSRSESGLNLDKSTDQINQYNDIVKEDAGLTLRSLPPVKLSIKNSKTKFLKSPRDDEASSRILKPHLTLNTHSPGHHVFTEGISRNSEIPHPSFALQQLRVPYSNLPDNIRIYKEKDRFAFGVKTSREDVVSPYKLAAKPARTIQVIDIKSKGSSGNHTGVQLGVKGVKNATESPKRATPKGPRTSGVSGKSNIIRLDPIIAGSESSYDTSGTMKEVTVPSIESFAHDKSFFVTEATKISMATDNSEKLKPPAREGRLSVVSIGDTVNSTFLENQKRKARQLYPIYDHKTKVKETYNKMKFKSHTSDFQPARRPKPLPEAFTYKISTRSFGHGSDASATNIKPIRNNLLDREFTREMSGHNFGESVDVERNMREYFEPKLRKYYSKYSKRGPFRPSSVDSDCSSTDMSQLPANPPPSEISHIHSEDMVINYNEHRPDMVTLHEERTQTAELTAANIRESRNRQSTDDVKAGNSSQTLEIHEGNIDSVSEGKGIDTVQDKKHYSVDEVVNADNDTVITDTDILMDKVNQNAYRMPESNEEPGSVTDRYAPITEMSRENTQVNVSVNLDAKAPDSGEGQPLLNVENMPDVESQSVPITMTDGHGNPTSKKLTHRGNPNKKCLSVPRLSLEKISNHPLLPNIKERTSLSRTLQNISVEDQVLGPHVNEVDSDSTDPDRLSLRIKDLKTSIPVTKIRLFSSSTVNSNQAPSLNVTDDLGEDHPLVYENYYGEENDQHAKSSQEKKLVSSSNIAFVSPLKYETRAKRQ